MATRVVTLSRPIYVNTGPDQRAPQRGAAAPSRRPAASLATTPPRAAAPSKAPALTTLEGYRLAAATPDQFAAFRRAVQIVATVSCPEIGITNGLRIPQGKCEVRWYHRDYDRMPLGITLYKRLPVQVLLASDRPGNDCLWTVAHELVHVHDELYHPEIGNREREDRAYFYVDYAQATLAARAEFLR